MKNRIYLQARKGCAPLGAAAYEAWQIQHSFLQLPADNHVPIGVMKEPSRSVDPTRLQTKAPLNKGK